MGNNLPFSLRLLQFHGMQLQQAFNNVLNKGFCILSISQPWIFETNPTLKANFLRTYIPDVEIPEELIRNQLIEDTTLSRTYEIFDPYLGNLLGSFEPQNGNGSAFLIFPTGETHRDLRESPTWAEVPLTKSFSRRLHQYRLCRSSRDFLQAV